MYSRDFGGIQSEGQLYNFEREYNESRREQKDEHREEDTKSCELTEVPKKNPPKGLSFLRNLKLDDLLLIGIGLLLLLDSEEENDIFSLLIAVLLML